MWQTERSYRLNMVLSFVSLVFVVVPLYFVTNALHPLMADSIRTQSTQYFSFALVGAVSVTIVSASLTTLPSALASAIQRGTLEAYLGTPASPQTLFTGLSAYGIIWAIARAVVTLGAGALLGAHVWWGALPGMMLVLLLLVVAYGAMGLFAAALVIYFRTTGPVISAIVTLSVLLGGVYYPTQVIPSWLQTLSEVVPLTYGLRAFR